MKKLLPFFLLILSLSIFSQVPSYYNDVNINQTGNDLKEALAIKIISSHTNILTYTPDVWNALKQTDIDPTDNSKVVLIYGWDDTDTDITNDRTREKDTHGSGSGVWNREHVYSKSLANPNLGTVGAGADAHNLRPADAQRNSSRSNRKFAEGNGNSGATAEGNWYPGDEWKGDVARMMMYMYLRYGNQTLPINVGVGNPVANDTNMIELFLKWNAEDPVSILEKQRNPVLEVMQGNRNPFIDNPAFATLIWGGPQAENLFGGNGVSTDNEAPTTPANIVVSNISNTSVDLTWPASTDNSSVAGYYIYNNGIQVASTNNTSISVANLNANTLYNFTLTAYDIAGNFSQLSSVISVTTATNPVNDSIEELFISEYIEGSSYNKAIEIANFTGLPINLANYSIKKATNGGGSWSNTLDLTGTLNNNEVYVIAHNSASDTVKNKSNLLNSSVMNFNGNDAIALFKNDILIDVLGTQNSSDNFGKDKTLQRKPTIKSPNKNYTLSEWAIIAKDTFNGLGEHLIDNNISEDNIAPTAPTNLLSNNITQTSVKLTWDASTDNVTVVLYEVYQNDTLITTVNNTSVTVNNLTDDTAYNFSVKAIDSSENISSFSNKAFITTLAAPDTTAPSSPSNLSTSNITETSVNLSWNASTDNTAVTGYDVYKGSAKIASVTTTNYSVSGLTAATNYTFNIRAKDAAGNISTSSNTIGVTTKSVVVTYCTSKGNNSSYEYIDNVAIGGISNVSSSNNGYGDFTAQTGNISFGNNTIILSAGFSGSSYTEFWKVWIDFNKNGVFESNEEVVSGSSSSSANLSARFTVPTSALTGKTRMRVAMKWDAAPSACETFAYGEVEDYSVNIGVSAKGGNNTNVIAETKLGNETAVFNAILSPNPTTDYLKIEMADKRDANYTIVNVIGQKVLNGKVNHSTINVSNLENGMYILKINDGQRAFTKKFIKK